MTSSESVQSVQYLSSIPDNTVSVSEGVCKNAALGCGLSNNNNTPNTYVVIKSEQVFESYPENGERHGEPGSDVNNSLSLTSALTFLTSSSSTEETTQSQIINNNNNHVTTKITENHLSTKVYRGASAPYTPPKSKTSTTQADIPLEQDMYDSVMVSNVLVNNSSSGQSSINGNSIGLPSSVNQFQSTKIEPNGNNIEIQLIDSRNNSTSTSSNGPLHENNDVMMMHGSSNHSSGGGTTLMVMSHGNGVSLTSPGGSLEDQDCDEEKVINGDTFSPGDVPDPDAIKMFVGQIPKHLSESELKTLFEEFGRVFQINVLRDKVSKQSKGCCFVTFYTRKAALDAQNALHNVKTLSGMNHPIQMKPADNENRYERKLFVGMLSKKCNESDVRSMFSRFGFIDECTVLRDPQGTSRGCAFITFASKQCAQSAIKALHHSLTMEGCTSPVVVKFADTQKDKDQKRHQHIHTSILPTFQSTPSSVNVLSPHYFSLLQQLQQQQQQQQQQQSNSYFSSLSPLSGIATLASLASPNSGASLAGLTGSHSSGATNDLATLAALVNFSGVGMTSNSHSVALGVQAAIAAALNGSHTSLSQDFSYSGTNGGSLGSTNSLAGAFTGNGLHSGMSSYTSALRSSVVNKQAEGPEGANLFIYHLPPEATDPDLISMFSPFGTVISAKVYIDKNTNRSKCFGFVSYDNAMSAQMAIQTMNGFQVGMKRLKVQLKRSKEAAKPY